MHTCMKCLEDAQGTLQFKVLPRYLCPSPGVRLTHKITKPNGCLTQNITHRMFMQHCEAQSASNRPEVIAGLSKSP